MEISTDLEKTSKKRPLSETSPESHSGQPEAKKPRKVETEHKDDPHSPVLEKLQKQIEYYFSNDNLPFDHFMQKHLEQNDGWFRVDTLLDFRNVMQLTQSVDTIISAIKRSEKLVFDASQNRVKRNESVSGHIPSLQQINNCIIFAKGFSPRMHKDALKKYWEQTLGESKVLAVRPILTNLTPQFGFSQGKDNNNKKKDQDTQVLKQFMGDCYVLLSDIETVKEVCGKTFDCSGRYILTGPSEVYRTIDRLEVQNEVLPFQEDKCLYIQNLPYYATWIDVEKWIKFDDMTSVPLNTAYVYKHCGEGFAYARLDENCSAAEAERLLNSRPLMGIQPKVKALPEEESQKVWGVVGVRRVGATVNIVTKNQPHNNEIYT